MTRRSPVWLALLASCSGPEVLVPHHPGPRDPVRARCTPAPIAARTPQNIAPIAASDHVHFDPSAIVWTDASAADQRALITAVVELHTSWLVKDRDAYVSRLAPDVTRLTEGASRVQRGPAEVLAALEVEWASFEHANGALAGTVELQEVELHVDRDAAFISYFADRTDDSRYVTQAFARAGDRWLLVHETAAPELETSDDGGFDFDFAYPVEDLARAIAFYTPILGEPAIVSEEEAIFGSGTSRFRLDATRLGGRAELRRGLPNGYAIFSTPDLDTKTAELRRAGVTFLGDVEDRRVVALDPAQNVFVLHESRADTTSLVGARVEVENDDECSRAVASALEAFATEEPLLFGDRDRGLLGLSADLEARAISATAIGENVIATFELEVIGRGSNPYREQAIAMILFTPEGYGADFAFVRADAPKDALALGLDYAGYPTEQLADAERFYSAVMSLGEPFGDEYWFSWWGRSTVFGVYAADAAVDRIPVEQRANGYTSFWVASAENAYAYLSGQGVEFPVVPAINAVAGVDPQPGYIQVVAEDSEGNLVVFGEYIGQ